MEDLIKDARIEKQFAGPPSVLRLNMVLPPLLPLPPLFPNNDEQKLLSLSSLSVSLSHPNIGRVMAFSSCNSVRVGRRSVICGVDACSSFSLSFVARSILGMNTASPNYCASIVAIHYPVTLVVIILGPI